MGGMGLKHLGKMARSWTTSTLLCRLIVQPPSYDFNRGTWNVPLIPVIADGYERGTILQTYHCSSQGRSPTKPLRRLA